MIGLSHSTGQILAGWALFLELVQDALTTPLGSREKRRDYGSRLPSLLGKITGDDVLTKAEIYATETFVHPPNKLRQMFTVQQVQAQRIENGLQLYISGQYLENPTANSQSAVFSNGQTVTFEVPIHVNGS